MKQASSPRFRKGTVYLSVFLVYSQVLYLAAAGLVGHMALPGAASAHQGKSNQFTQHSLEIFFSVAECSDEKKPEGKGDTAATIPTEELQALLAWGDGKECDGSKKKGGKDVKETEANRLTPEALQALQSAGGADLLLADCEGDKDKGRKGDTAKVNPIEPPCIYCLTPQGVPVSQDTRVAITIIETGQLVYPLADNFPRLESFSPLNSRAPPGFI